MSKKMKKDALPEAVLTLAKKLVNNTPDGDAGYGEAADTVSEIWDQFDAAGATVKDMERITGFIRYCKFEGFCKTCPVN